MTSLCVYALLAADLREPVGPGVAGEPVYVVGADGVYAAVGEVAGAPPIGVATLRAHDAVVRRLAAVADAVLPARFGSLVPDRAALIERLAPARAVVSERLALVAGREQMTLRLFAEDAAPPAARPVAGGAPIVAGAAPGPGARYLEERRQAWRREPAGESLRPLRAALAALARAERVERHQRPPLVATLHHLIARGESMAYAAAVERAAAALEPGRRVVVRGPWPAYAFAPEALA